MKDSRIRQRVSGFTLIEMIIVMGIITVLIAVLVPAMSGYITRSRLNTANANAKVLFNSVQTVMQEYEFRERQQPTSAFYGTNKHGTLFLAGEDGVIDRDRIAGTGDTFAVDDNMIATLGLNGVASPAGTFGSRLSRLFDDYGEVAWAVYISDYRVMGVVCADNGTTPYIGAYPMRTTERLGDTGCEIAFTVGNADIADMLAYSNTAWHVTSE